MHRSRFFLLTLALLASAAARAQPGTSSPYSISGLGELKYRGFADQYILGGTSVAFREKDNFSVQNPASYSALRSVVYNAGMSMNRGTLDDGVLQSSVENGNFDYFALGFATPYSEKMPWGISLGFQQLTDVGYRIRANNADSLDSYNEFEGIGGLNDFHVGFGMEVYKGLSFGLNMNYLFGDVQANVFHVIPRKSHFSFYDHSEMYYGGFSWDFGVQYTIRSGYFDHGLGATYSTQASLNGNGERLSQSFFGKLYDEGGFLPIDTLIFEDDLQAERTVPAKFNIAYSLSYKDIWGVALEMEQAGWSSVINPLDGKAYNNNNRYGFGAWYIPKPDYTVEGNYMGKVRYSLGLHYQELFYRYFDQSVDEFGIRFGLGLPVVRIFQSRSGKIPMVNRVTVGMDYLKRGSNTDQLIQETYYGLRIGLNFNDKWFLKRKYQ